ncbi:MAG TPA: hypothetical protein VHC69_10675 [Polyangiaceae bacterium]|nr:hypothetical protein [Polyangiaceae bacterium]
MTRLLPVLAFFALAAGGCNNSSATLTGVTPATAVAVDPIDFLGPIKCGTGPGEMQLYVATLFDDSSRPVLGIGDTKLILPSSAPTGCGVPVLFENILQGREYEAAVDGYDRSDIVPLGTQVGSPPVLGSRTMVECQRNHDDPTKCDAIGDYVAPRWTTRCGHHRLPPAARDGGLTPGIGKVEYADSGLQPDGGWLDCRPVAYYPGTRTPWLGGPVCASTQLTVTVRGCDPLSE